MKVKKIDLIKQAQTLISYAIALLEVAEGNHSEQLYVVNQLKALNSYNLKLAPHTNLNGSINLDDLMSAYYEDEKVELPTNLNNIYNIH